MINIESANDRIILRCTVNGHHVERKIRSGMNLLEFLRKDLNLTGTKEGCGQGECGACIVLVNGMPVNSCLCMAIQMQGREILTIEGLAGADSGLHPLQKSFMEESAVQCGFCTPAMIMSAYALLMKNSSPSKEDIKEALASNICRCTGYDKIFRAVMKASELLQKRE